MLCSARSPNGLDRLAIEWRYRIDHGPVWLALFLLIAIEKRKRGEVTPNLTDNASNLEWN